MVRGVKVKITRTSGRATHRAPKSGTTVKVPFGARDVEATVVAGRHGRVEVEIKIKGADPIRTSYAAKEIRVSG